MTDQDFIQLCNRSDSMLQASESIGQAFNTFKRRATKLNCFTPNQPGKGLIKKRPIKIKTIDILQGKYPNFQTYKLKNRLLKEGYLENKCYCCGITVQNNNPIKFDLHHIDGNNKNHKLNNLLLICPNCHSQTPTYKGKNKIK